MHQFQANGVFVPSIPILSISTTMFVIHCFLEPYIPCYLPLSLNSGLSWPPRLQSESLTLTSTKPLPPCSLKNAISDQRKTPCADVDCSLISFQGWLSTNYSFNQKDYPAFDVLPTPLHHHIQKISGSKFWVSGSEWGSGNCLQVFVLGRNSPERAKNGKQTHPRGFNALPLILILEKVVCSIS